MSEEKKNEAVDPVDELEDEIDEEEKEIEVEPETVVITIELTTQLGLNDLRAVISDLLSEASDAGDVVEVNSITVDKEQK